MQTSKGMRDLIKQWEASDGPKLRAYLCPAGVWTIGWGHTKTVKPNQTIDLKTAERLFLGDLYIAEQAVNKTLEKRTVPLKQREYDALVSWTFNCGVNSLRNTNGLKYLLKGSDGAAWAFLEQWVKDGNGNPLPGLIKRRAAEKRWFERGTLK